MVLSRCQPYRAPMQRGETCAESLHAVRACAAEGEMFQHEIGIVTHAAPANGPGYAYGATCKNCSESVRLGGEHLARLRTTELHEIPYRRILDHESLIDAAATHRPPHMRAKRHAGGWRLHQSSFRDRGCGDTVFRQALSCGGGRDVRRRGGRTRCNSCKSRHTRTPARLLGQRG